MRTIFFIVFVFHLQILSLQAADNIRLRNAGGKCLAIKGNNIISNSKTIHIWNCNSSKNQKWQLDKQQRLVNNIGKCLTAKGNGRAGKALIVGICNQSAKQRWRFDSRDRLVNESKGKCLEVSRSGMRKKGSKVYLWHCKGSTNQRWYKDYIIGYKQQKPSKENKILTKEIINSKQDFHQYIALSTTPSTHINHPQKPFGDIFTSLNQVLIHSKYRLKIILHNHA